MEQVFWDRKEGARCVRQAPSACSCAFPLPPHLPPRRALFAANLESRRVDISNPTYKGSDVDLTFPSPGCGGGPWDCVPPGHKAQAVDLALARPVLDKLGLPDTVEGACLETQGSAVPEVWSEDFPGSPRLSLTQATSACSAPPTWAHTWGGAPSGGRHRRMRRWRGGGTR